MTFLIRFYIDKRQKGHHEYLGRRKEATEVIYHNSAQKLRNEGLILFAECVTSDIVRNGPALYFMRLTANEALVGLISAAQTREHQ